MARISFTREEKAKAKAESKILIALAWESPNGDRLDLSGLASKEEADKVVALLKELAMPKETPR